MSDDSDTGTSDGGDFEDVDSTSERGIETKRHGSGSFSEFLWRDHQNDEKSRSRSSSRSSGRQYFEHQPSYPNLDSGTDNEHMVGMGGLPNLDNFYRVGSSTQPPVLPTISQDLTEGLQKERDENLGAFASKFGGHVPGTSPSGMKLSTRQTHQERILAHQERILEMNKKRDIMARQQEDTINLKRREIMARQQEDTINLEKQLMMARQQQDTITRENLLPAYGSIHDTSASRFIAEDLKQMPGLFAHVDWRKQVCATLGIDHRASDADILVAVQQNSRVRPEISPPEPHFKILYEVNCKKDRSRLVYEDMPYVSNPESRKNHLRGHKMMSNFDLFVERHPGLSFIVYRQFDCCQKGVDKKPYSKVELVQSTDSISLISRTLISALRKAARASKRGQLYPEFDHRKRLEAPYLWFFHDYDDLLKYIPRGVAKDQPHLHSFFWKYMDKHMAKEYDEVRSMLSKNMISQKYISYLFAPGDLLLKRDGKKTNVYDKVFLQELWPEKFIVSEQDEDKGGQNEMVRISSKITSITWEYDGKFSCRRRQINFQHDTAEQKQFRIQSMAIFPLRFADQQDTSRLKSRGRKLWECRHKKLISYSGWDFSQIDHFKDTRVMVDMQTYNKLHQAKSGPKADKAESSLIADKAKSSRKAEEGVIEELDSDAMKKDRPPNEEIFYLLMPPNTFGFVMRTRKWHNIMVENMSEVQWEERAFDSLVMEPSTKELIQALVTSEIEESKMTDLMSGKGNGLIMLLHGGPGTGKTLTAESVAEYTRKPLYRITSGDIGTNPESVERYLDVVLDLGKQWDCVVLLDEAEVFLQTRSLTDLARNALVSVFLRVLEYFQGILILTSNRVATFDEAFKSRIQLALHYEPLGKKERKQVWQNFITRLETLDGSNVDAADLNENVDKLAEVNMNGRQIRNAITTARQLAKFKSKTEKTRVDYKRLEYIIGVSQKFDSYLSQVNEGLTDEEIARDEGVR